MGAFHTTIDIEGAELQLRFDYQPEEPCVPYYKDGTGDPGCAAQVDCIEVTWYRTDYSSELKQNVQTSIDVTDLMNEMGHEEYIEEQCFAHVAGLEPNYEND